MSEPFRRPLVLAVAALAALASVATPAQQAAKPKKLYCWDDRGSRVCSDTLPVTAAGNQRTELDARTGTAVKRVDRALTPEEQAQQLVAEQARRVQEEQARREKAMVVSFATEDDLRRSFQERFVIVDESLKGTSLAIVNLHKSLIALLRQANELELRSKPVGRTLREKIATQHAQLRQLREMQVRQRAERADIDAEFQAALGRYRMLKAENAGTASAAPTTTAPAPAPAASGG